MMKGKLMKSIFRTKGNLPRTPGPSCEDDFTEDQGRHRLHSEETSYSNNSLDSPMSESPRSWPSSLTTPMSYIKERKKRKASKFHIASPLESEKAEDNVFGVEEHNLSQSIHSDTVSFVSFTDSPQGGGDEEGDGAASSRSRHDSRERYQQQFQQLRLQLEVQQKIINQYEGERGRYEQKVVELTGQLDKKVRMLLKISAVNSL